jgi:hypothetical protein
MKLATVVDKVRALAEVVRDYWARELPKRHPHYPLEYPGEDDGPPPPEEKKLRQLLARLPVETLYKVAMIVNLGWRNFPVSELPNRYQEFREFFDTPSSVIEWLIGLVSAAEYLEDGMEMLEAQHIDLEKMDLDTARAKK